MFRVVRLLEILYVAVEDQTRTRRKVAQVSSDEARKFAGGGEI
jgi:hypothetical protein